MIRRVFGLVLIGLAFLFSPAYAWYIADYDVSIQLNQDSRFVVVETIQADFGMESKHGIYRDIPMTYNDENGKPYDIKFDVLEIADQYQQHLNYAEQNQANFKRIKIGRADQTVTGLQTYVITYEVSGAVLFLADHDELFWNAVGTQWDVPINHVSVSVNLPEGLSEGSIKLASYTGGNGSRTSNATNTVVNERLVKFEGSGYGAYEGFTIVVGMPKGVLHKPNNTQDGLYRKIEMGPWFLLIPLLAFAGLLRLWYIFGKDPQVEKSIAVEYKAPENFRPAEMGTILDENVDQRDISSVIIDLAIRGYIKIVQENNFLSRDYTLVLLKSYQDDASLKSHERMILEGIFDDVIDKKEVKLSELENKFYRNLNSIQKCIKADCNIDHYWVSNSTGLLVLLIFLGIVIFVMGIMAAFEVSQWLGLALMLTSVIFIVFGFIMPKRTLEGAQVLSKIFGFKEFLLRAEKDKIQRAEQQDIFERMLPFAICLGISTKWASKFDGIYAQPPQWFVGNYTTFHHDRFIHDLNNSLNRMGTSFYSQPQQVSLGGGFSGGGSSGGGFGGGGGGSW